MADIRNAISIGVMNHLMVPVVHPALILNSDASQYATAMDSQDNVTVVYIKKNVTSDLDRGDKFQ